MRLLEGFRVVSYYKSRYLSPPVVYVQQDDGWKSYAPGGRIQKNIGPLPNYILQNADEVPSNRSRT